MRISDWSSDVFSSDLGVIIGAAFGKIIDSLVKDIIMPLVAFVVGGEVDFTNQFWVLRAPENFSGPETYDALTKAGAVVVSWGNFLTILINFVLLAFVVFCLVKAVNAARKRVARQEEVVAQAAPRPRSEESGVGTGGSSTVRSRWSP